MLFVKVVLLSDVNFAKRGDFLQIIFEISINFKHNIKEDANTVELLQSDQTSSYLPGYIIHPTSEVNFMELLGENHNGAMNKMEHDLQLMYSNKYGKR